MIKLKQIKQILIEHNIKNKIIKSILKSLMREKDVRGKIYRFLSSDDEIKQLEPWMIRHFHWKNGKYCFKSDSKTKQILKDVEEMINCEAPGQYSTLINDDKAISYRIFKKKKYD